MAAERPIVIRTVDGREVGVDSLDLARQHYPDAEWLGYQENAERFEQPRPLAEVETDPNKMTRDELNAYATDRGVADAEGFRTKADLVAALSGRGGIAAPEAPAAEAPAEAPAIEGEGE